MDKWVDRFREVAQPKKQKSANIEAAISLNGMSADLHHKFTPCILLIFTLVIFYPFFISSPINCFVSQPAGAPTASVVEENFLNNYCFSLSTYTVFNYLEAEMVELEPLLYPGVGPETSETEQTRHNYYQFVPYVLLLQCIFFRVSYYWWKNGAHQEGGLIRKLVGYLDDVEMSIAQEPHPTTLRPTAPPHRSVHFFEPARNSTQIIEGGPTVVDTPRGKSDGEESTERSKLEQVVDYCHRRLGGFTVLGSMWLFCDSLALVITVFNFFITDWLLGGVFFSYGLSAMNLDWVGADGQTVNFPRMTKCRVGKYGASGSVENRDALCVLGLNLYYSYMFLFLWCWYIALFIITLCAFIYKLFRIALLKFAPEYFVMSARGTVTRLPVAELARCVSAMTPSDLVFFCLLCQNLRPKTCLAFVNALAAKFKDKLLFAEV